MRWLKKDIWKLGIPLAGLLLLLIFMVWIPVSAADAHTGTPEFATPTVDLTVTALAKEQLTLKVKQLQQSEDRGFSTWLWNNAATIVASFLSTLVVVIGVLIGFRQWRTNRNDTLTKESNDRKEAQERDLRDREAERQKEIATQDKELKDRQEAQSKEFRAQAEERFKTAVTALGSKNEATQVGGAILLRSFLNKDDEEIYGRYYAQIFDLAVGYLRVNKARRPGGASAPLPLTPLRQSFIVVFQEAYPLARNRLGQIKSSLDTRSLDASRIRLDGAFLVAFDLKHIWMIDASIIQARLSTANLFRADLRRTIFRRTILTRVNLSKANLTQADLSEADLSNANLTGANLRGVKFNGAILSGADFSEANFGAEAYVGEEIGAANPEDALSLEDAYLYKVKGLSKEQLAACKAKGAYIDEAPIISSPPSTVSPSAPSPQSS